MNSSEIIFNIHGSRTSSDIDVVIPIEKHVDFSIGLNMIHTYNELITKILQESSLYDTPLKPVNSNLVVVDNGNIIWSHIGNVDEVNNGIYLTYNNHKQLHKLIVESLVDRNIVAKIIRSIRVILMNLSRTNQRDRIKYALQQVTPVGEKVKVLKHINLENVRLSEDIVKINIEDNYKRIAFQIGQLTELLNNNQIFTKEEIIECNPNLETFILRQKSLYNFSNLEKSKNEMINLIEEYFLKNPTLADTLDCLVNVNTENCYVDIDIDEEINRDYVVKCPWYCAMYQSKNVCCCSPYRAEAARIKDIDKQIINYNMENLEKKINVNIVIDGDNFRHPVLFRLLEWFETNIDGDIVCVMSPNHYVGFMLNRFGNYYKNLFKDHLRKNNIYIIRPTNNWSPSNGSEDEIVIHYAKFYDYIPITNDTFKNKRNEYHQYAKDISDKIVNVNIDGLNITFSKELISQNFKTYNLSFDEICEKVLFNHIISNLEYDILAHKRTIEAYEKRMKSYNNNLKNAYERNDQKNIEYYNNQIIKYQKNSQSQLERAYLIIANSEEKINILSHKYTFL